jgi:hypothetical protein
MLESRTRQGDEAHAEAICGNLRLPYCPEIDGRARKSDVRRSRIPTPLPARSFMSTERSLRFVTIRW